MGDGFAALHDVRNDVLAEVAARVRIGCVAAQKFHQELGVEDIDAHGGKGEALVAGNARRVGRLLDEINNPVCRIDMHHAEAVASIRGTSRQPMVTSAPELTCCCSISS